MNSSLQPLIALSNINALPDGYLHSKISFLKSVINEQQNPQMREMKQKMLKLSYTIKNIGIHGEQIGITSKRLPLKEKQQFKPSQITLQKQKDVYRKKYLPQNTFYAQALVPVKKKKDSTIQIQLNESSKNPLLVTASHFHNDFAQTFHISPETKFAKKLTTPEGKFGRNFSLASRLKINLNLNKQDNQKQSEFISKVTTVHKSHSEHQLSNRTKLGNKKSFAKLLTEMDRKSKNIEIMPLQHEQNPLFRKIQKLQKLSTFKENTIFQKYKSARGLSHSSSTQNGQYRTMLSTTKNLQYRRSVYKIE